MDPVERTAPHGGRTVDAGEGGQLSLKRVKEPSRGRRIGISFSISNRQSPEPMYINFKEADFHSR